MSHIKYERAALPVQEPLAHFQVDASLSSSAASTQGWAEFQSRNWETEPDTDNT